MDVNEFQRLAKRTMPKPQQLGNGTEWYNNLQKANYAMGLAGEAGELVDVIKKEIFHNHPPDLEKKINEMGDLMHYAAGVANMYNFTLEEAMEFNTNKLRKRFPNGFNSEDSIKRVDVNGDK